MDPLAEFAREAGAAFEAELSKQLTKLGRLPAADSADVGIRAAREAVAWQTWEDVGPFLDAAGASNVLGVESQTLGGHVTTGRLLGLVLAGEIPESDRMVFPAWQFNPQVRDRLSAVLAAAGHDPMRPTSGWAIAAWLTTPNAALDGRSALEVLRAGELDRVLAAARAVAEPGSPPLALEGRGLAAGSVEAASRTGTSVDALALGRERFAAARQQLYDDSLTPEQAAAASARPISAVERLMASGGLVVVEGPDGPRLPKWQFDDEGQPLQRLAAVIAGYPDSSIMLSEWIHHPNPMLQRRSPRQALLDGDALEASIAARAINLR